MNPADLRDLQRRIETVERIQIQIQIQIQLLNNQAVNELKVKLSESELREGRLRECLQQAKRELQRLRDRVLALEFDKRSSAFRMEKLAREKSEAGLMLLEKDEILKESERRSSEMLLELEKEVNSLKKIEQSKSVIRKEKLKESLAEAKRSLEELRARLSDSEVEKKIASLIIEELMREKSEADEIVKESRRRNTKARVDDRGEEVVSSRRGEKRKRSESSPLLRKRLFGADMARAFHVDDDMCVEAVCTLYRQHMSESESSEGSKRRFYHFERLWQHGLANFLMQGDPELRVTRHVAEVKPHIVNLCRRLAIEYSSYFIAMPGTASSGQDELHAFSLCLVRLCCYADTDTHDAGSCEDTSLDNIIEIPDH